jgi:hypothetical protein
MAVRVALDESLCVSIPQPWSNKDSIPSSENPITIAVEKFVFLKSLIEITLC